MRLTVSDVLQSRFPQVLGLCSDDVGGVCKALNAVVQRLNFCKELGDAGWVGSWCEYAFDVAKTDPFFVAPREVERLEVADICSYPVVIHGPFWEFLKFGAGRWPKRSCANGHCAPLAIYDRGYVPTFQPIVGTRKTLRIYPGSTGDTGARVLVQCEDSNGMVVRTQDGLLLVQGIFVPLAYPFADLILQGQPLEIRAITGLQKDITIGSVFVYERDLDTGAERLISTMDPGETIASYRKYYFGGIPLNCCNPSDAVNGTTVQVTAIAKLAFLPVAVPTDYLLLNNLEALIAEAQSLRMSQVDGLAAKSEAIAYHKMAVALLNGQSIATHGKLSPDISFAPFGSARLSRQKIGIMQ